MAASGDCRDGMTPRSVAQRGNGLFGWQRCYVRGRNRSGNRRPGRNLGELHPRAWHLRHSAPNLHLPWRKCGRETTCVLLGMKTLLADVGNLVSSQFMASFRQRSGLLQLVRSGASLQAAGGFNFFLLVHSRAKCRTDVSFSVPKCAEPLPLRAHLPDAPLLVTGSRGGWPGKVEPRSG